MRLNESIWIRKQLIKLGVEAASPIANVGSSTDEFRRVKKPHIQRELLDPLESIGFQFIHLDIRHDIGVDLVGDLTDPEFLIKVRDTNCKSVICSNLLEHLSIREPVAEACEDLVGIGGTIIVTVPNSYPYHPDPIDTMYRPRPQDLLSLFKRSELVEATILEDGSLYNDDFNRPIKAIRSAALYAFRIARFWRRDIASSHLNKLMWMGHPYKITCAVLKRV